VNLESAQMMPLKLRQQQLHNESKMIRTILVTLITIFLFACDSEYYSGPEAREWLKNNKNEYALAGNRFGKTEEALKFVDLLYKNGASLVVISKVGIYDEVDRIEKEGGTYADSLVVTLPADVKKRNELIEIFKKEASDQGFVFNPNEDIKNDKVFLWWD
jgi:predicted DNA-binding protein YlxM (UPF0122 family)